MIGSLRGLLMDKDREGEVIVEVGGVGYRVSVNPGTLAELPEIGSDVFVHIHHHIREGDQQFYGFATLAARKCFESVIGAHGVGPALAMAVRATLPPDELGLAGATNDVDALCLVPGVGKKTAQRKVLELKNRLEISAFANGELEVDNLGVSTALGDVRYALSQMGFGTDEVRRAVEGIEGDDTSIMLRVALQRLAAK